MADYREKFHESIAEYVRSELGWSDVRTVLGVKEREEVWECGEGTCWNSETYLDITYRDTTGRRQLRSFTSDIYELINALTVDNLS